MTDQRRVSRLLLLSSLLLLTLLSLVTAAAPSTYSSTLSDTLKLTPKQPFTYRHYTLNDAHDTPLVSPVFPSGLSVTFSASSSALRSCSYAVCLSHLLRPVDDVDEWRSRQLPPLLPIKKAPSAGPSDVCEGYFNMSSSVSSPFSAVFFIKPGGIKHVSVLAALNDPSATAGAKCDFQLSMSGDVCEEGKYGADCSIQPPTTHATAAAPLTATLSAESDAVVYFETHPINIYATALLLNITSSADNFTTFISEGNLPAVDGAPLSPITDFNVTSVSTQSTVLIPFPSYRTGSQLNKRYFIGVSRAGAAQRDSPKESTISLAVQREYACGTGMRGKNCEYYVEYFIDPFELSASGMDRISADSFGFNRAKTEVWFYFSLVFLSIPPSQNFSVGVVAIDGQQTPAVYLRQGQIPTLTQFDYRSSSVDSSQPIRFFRSGPTELHDAVWFVGLNVPLSWDSIGDVGLFINSDCPGTTSQLQVDGSLLVTPCNGRGRCIADTHHCECVDRWTGYSCLDVDDSVGMTGAERAGLVLLVISLTAGLCWFLIWHLGTNLDRRQILIRYAGAGVGYVAGGEPDGPAIARR